MPLYFVNFFHCMNSSFNSIINDFGVKKTVISAKICDIYTSQKLFLIKTSTIMTTHND